MTDLATQLERLGLELYLDAFVEEGFDTWETLLDIQESDLDALGVKLGHRRKLQRAIADYRGVPYERLFGSFAHDVAGDLLKPVDSKQPEGYFGDTPLSLADGQQSEASVNNGGQGGSAPPQEQKRKYRRHPKQDENAPEKPPSAYVLFSNKTRMDVKAEHLSFTEIAKLVGERWQKLDPSEKEPYESHAQALKESYHIQLSAYKKTEAYRSYMQYLAEFKLKHGQVSDSKRPKLDPQSSGGSISTTSQDLSESVTPGPAHMRRGSLEAMSAVSQSGLLSSRPSPTALTTTTQIPSLSTSSSIPLISAPQTVSPSSSQHARDPQQIARLSTQTSFSEDSGQTRSEFQDPLPRAATLSLSTPPAVTPPLPANVPTASRLDQGGGSDAFTWSVPRHPQQTSSLSSPHGPGLTFPSPVANEAWRDRLPEPHRQPQSPVGHFPPPLPLMLAPIIAPERLPDLTRMQAQRTLPPLQRQYPAGSSSHATFAPQQITQAQIKIVPRPSHAIELHENEAATTLAALAKRSPNEHTPRPSESY